MRPVEGGLTPVSLFERAEAVLVDLDGTLVDSTRPVRRAWDEFAARHGLDAETVMHFAHGRPSRDSIQLLLPDASELEIDTEAARLDDGEINDTEGVIALPGAFALLSGTRPLAIVTSASTALARGRLAAAELPIPEVLVSSDGLEQGKPDPSCFLIAAERLGVEPQRCVVLEDAPAGILAGLRAGAVVIAVRTTHEDDELGEATAIVDDLASLLGG
ncbi:MAG TPA: HAD-IA family hydrolase [Solirubrobacteraceae bacterium]